VGGSKEFVNEAFAAAWEQFTAKRKDDARYAGQGVTGDYLDRVFI
jgi:hypothetical protein